MLQKWRKWVQAAVVGFKDKRKRQRHPHSLEIWLGCLSHLCLLSGVLIMSEFRSTEKVSPRTMARNPTYPAFKWIWCSSF